MQTTQPVIGKHEIIHLHKEGFLNVPAKIDTGADKCSIWASNIQENNGVLNFSLFGEGSRLYTGNIITTTDYTAVPVKNSFGVTEVRFMVKLSMKLGGKNYKVRFTLADRSRNKFPVLLGMNFLKNRFWVNVAENYLQSPGDRVAARDVIVLSARPNAARKNYFERLKAYHKNPVNYVTVAVDDLVYEFGDKPKVTIGVGGKDIKTYGMAYFKSYKEKFEQAVTAADYLQYENVRVIDDEILHSISASKLSEMMRFNCHALPVPKSIAMSTDNFKKNYKLVAKTVGVPFVLKDAYSEKGKNNYLISNETEYAKVLKESSTSCYFIAQEYIRNEGFVRLLVMNKGIPVVIRRTKHKHAEAVKSHLNKPAGGANAELADSSELSEACSLAMRASVVMKRPLAGVDMIQDLETKKWYILEANSSPQLMGDKFEEEKAKALAKYIEYELERS